MSSRCDCPSPPGGAVTCSPEDFAYCYVLDGRVQSGCYKVKPNVTAKEFAFLAFVVDELPSGYGEELQNQWDTVRMRHTMVSDDGNFRFNFSPPESGTESEPQKLFQQT